MYGLIRQGFDNMSKRNTSSSDPFYSFFLDEFFPRGKKNDWTYTSISAEPRQSAFSYKSETTDTGARLTIDVPGIKPGDMSLYVENGMLVVEGKRDDVQRSTKFTIDGYDPTSIKASLSDGVLIVNLSVSSAEKPSRVPIDIELKKPE